MSGESEVTVNTKMEDFENDCQSYGNENLSAPILNPQLMIPPAPTPSTMSNFKIGEHLLEDSLSQCALEEGGRVIELDSNLTIKRSRTSRRSVDYSINIQPNQESPAVSNSHDISNPDNNGAAISIKIHTSGVGIKSDGSDSGRPKRSYVPQTYHQDRRNSLQRLESLESEELVALKAKNEQLENEVRVLKKALAESQTTIESLELEVANLYGSIAISPNTK